MFVVRCDEHCFLLPEAPFEEKGVFFNLGIYKSVIKAYNNGITQEVKTMEKVIIKEVTRFFKNQKEMQEFAENMRAKPNYKIVGYGKNNGSSYFVKYRNQEV